MSKTPEEAKALALKYAAEMTDEEDAAITAAAESDPDCPPLTEEWFARAKRGRPPKDAPKALVTIRLDPEVLERLRASGPGWQSRINDTLRKVVGL